MYFQRIKRCIHKNINAITYRGNLTPTEVWSEFGRLTGLTTRKQVDKFCRNLDTELQQHFKRYPEKKRKLETLEYLTCRAVDRQIVNYALELCKQNLPEPGKYVKLTVMLFNSMLQRMHIPNKLHIQLDGNYYVIYTTQTFRYPKAFVLVDIANDTAKITLPANILTLVAHAKIKSTAGIVTPTKTHF